MEKFYSKNKNRFEFSRARWPLFKQGGIESSEMITSTTSKYKQTPEEIQELIEAVVEEFKNKENRLPTPSERELLIQKTLQEARFAQERVVFAAQTRELAEAKLLAETDHLTGLLNRRGLEARMNQLCALAERSDQSISFIAFDLDSFKRVNDGFGHGVGDSMLKHLSVILSRRARKMDLVVRQGGEEFLVVLPNANETQALEVAEDFRRVIEQDLKKSIIQELPEEQRADAERLIKGTASIGVGTTTSADWKEALEQADDALYVAKKLRGKNTVVGVSQVTHEDRLAMEELRKEEALKSKAEKQAHPEKMEVDRSFEAQLEKTAQGMTEEDLHLLQQARALLEKNPKAQRAFIEHLKRAA